LRQRLDRGRKLVAVDDTRFARRWRRRYRRLRLRPRLSCSRRRSRTTGATRRCWNRRRCNDPNLGKRGFFLGQHGTWRHQRRHADRPGKADQIEESQPAMCPRHPWRAPPTASSWLPPIRHCRRFVADRHGLIVQSQPGSIGKGHDDRGQRRQAGVVANNCTASRIRSGRLRASSFCLSCDDMLTTVL